MRCCVEYQNYYDLCGLYYCTDQNTWYTVLRQNFQKMYPWSCKVNATVFDSFFKLIHRKLHYSSNNCIPSAQRSVSLLYTCNSRSKWSLVLTLTQSFYSLKFTCFLPSWKQQVKQCSHQNDHTCFKILMFTLLFVVPWESGPVFSLLSWNWIPGASTLLFLL